MKTRRVAATVLCMLMATAGCGIVIPALGKKDSAPNTAAPSQGQTAATPSLLTQPSADLPPSPSRSIERPPESPKPKATQEQKRLEWPTSGETTTFPIFMTPSRNIGCAVLGNEGLRCDIVESSYRKPQKPADCEAAWAVSVMLPAEEEARFGCISDTVLNPGAPVLAYGKTNRSAPIPA